MKVSWTSPSNIALIKYWGKYGNQLPCNPSLSFSLEHSSTTLSIETHNKSTNVASSFLFEGKANDKFGDKIFKFLNTVKFQLPWIDDYSFSIESSNTFPHSSGIASSASSMSSLALCLLSLDEMITGNRELETDFLKRASSLARLASGSASRSVYPQFSLWGKVDRIDTSSNDFAIPLLFQNNFFSDYCDSILIINSLEKSVSSSEGHNLMINHPFKEQRYDRARFNLNRLLDAIDSIDISVFIEVVEEEALMLHALMMTSQPSYILLRPQSLFLIDKIRSFRNETSIPVCFTIDAGPNIHLLYPQKYILEVKRWIESDLKNELIGLIWIHDKVGNGPSKNLGHTN